MKFHIYRDKEQVARELARWISELAQETLEHQEYFSIALSGGETPKLLFNTLASEFKKEIDWTRMQIFWGDERMVPFDDDRNNAKMAYDLLISNVDILPSNVHLMRTNLEPVFSAQQYEKVLRTYFSHASRSFDLILLGMGNDGHTLSLFPNSPVLHEAATQNWVSAVYNKDQQMYRLTLMPSIVNRASHIAFMLNGYEKSKILKKVIEGNYNPSLLPAQLIQPTEGELHWFLDTDAARELKHANTSAV
jgi:6-phosphogluconolactonase